MTKDELEEISKINAMLQSGDATEADLDRLGELDGKRKHEACMDAMEQQIAYHEDQISKLRRTDDMPQLLVHRRKLAKALAQKAQIVKN